MSVEEKVCTVDGCQKAADGAVLCAMHRWRLKHHGTTEEPRRPSAVERFLQMVEPTEGGCWLWTGTRIWSNYGQFWLDGRMWSAHRASFHLFVGHIPKGLTIDHLCHVADGSCPGGVVCPHRGCVNPDHLAAVTSIDNMRRGLGWKGRVPKARASK